MPFSHHSHSGQFCGHAKNTLEEMVQAAIAKGFHTFALTEHMPRPLEDFYPEEDGHHTEESLKELFDDYMAEATRVKSLYSSQIRILIGFETEWIRPSTNDTIQNLLEKYTFELFVGSVHHVHTIPIDFDRTMYEKAREKAGGTDERLFEDYFDAQLEMLEALRPPVVGHFDLIRLLSDAPDAEFQGLQGVWERIRRNLRYIVSYGGILELNSAALRKGLAEPYPCLLVCQMFLAMGGRFTFSDDSHGVDQIGTNYPRLLEFVQKAEMHEIYYASGKDEAKSRESRLPHGGCASIAVDDLARHPFWSTNGGNNL